MDYFAARHSAGKCINIQVSRVKVTIPILANPKVQTQAISHYRLFMIGAVLPILNLLYYIKVAWRHPPRANLLLRIGQWE
jgi:hypothetical protein